MNEFAREWEYTDEPPPEKGKNGDHQFTEEELRVLDKADLERYQLKDCPFPDPMGEAAFHGIAGRIVKIIEPASEACREAILGQLQVGLGNIVGRGPHRKQAGIHRVNEYAVLVGETSFGRKGTAWAATENLLKSLDEGWDSTRTRDGFQSGEAIIHSVRDPASGIIPVNKRKAGQADKVEKTILDEGVSDKRLMIVEEEFARLLSKASLPGNTLSPTLRKAWDAKEWLYTEGKVCPEKATGAHISMIGHITASELSKRMARVENENGFSNRILWVATRRVQELPFAPWVDWSEHPEIISHLVNVVETFSQMPRSLYWSEEAKEGWSKFYKSIKPGSQGIVGSIIARAHAHVLRLTMLYAVLDNSTLMEPQHLQAAIAFWEYCKRSAQWAFGENTGNKNADKIYWALQREPKGMTRTQIRLEVFDNHAPKTMLDLAFSDLVSASLAYSKNEHDIIKADKPIQRWFAR